MNLNEANLAWETFLQKLLVVDANGSSEERVRFWLDYYPQEAVDFLTQLGSAVLIVCYVAIAFLLYKLIGHMRYMYRFLISLVVFALAVCVDFVCAGLNVLGLEYALGFGFKVGGFAALLGLGFAAFYPAKKKDQV